MSREDFEEALFNHERQMGRIPNNAARHSPALIGPNHKPPGYHREQSRQALESVPGDLAKIFSGGLVVAANLAQRQKERRTQQATRGWRPDPTRRFASRWWTGFEWSRFVCDAGGFQHEDATATPRPGVSIAPPGWYPDPAGRFEQRYWDGVRWSHHTAGHAGERLVDPIVVPSDSRLVEIAEGSWAPDPLNQFSSRWWDGRRWTNVVRSTDGETLTSGIGEGLLKMAENWPGLPIQRFEGVGSDLVTLQPPDLTTGVDLLRARGTGKFAVSALDEDGQVLAVLIDSDSGYEGVTCLNQRIRYLRVEAPDTWNIEVLPPYPYVKYIAQDRPTEGAGDQVLVNLAAPTVARLVCEGVGSATLVVFDDQGHPKPLLDAEAPLDMRVPLPQGVLELRTRGRWALTH